MRESTRDFIKIFCYREWVRIYYGAAIQGNHDRQQRVERNISIVSFLKSLNVTVVSEHTTGRNVEEVAAILEKDFGKLPPKGPERTTFIRNKMIESIEGSIDAAIFDVSVPSLGTGIEIAHTYLRPRLGLKEIPILALYEQNYWPNKLSSMIAGITKTAVPHFALSEYSTVEDAQRILSQFIASLKS
ncbi:MAG: hypothetical protein AB7F43_01865 [Bacteriovoracia bacterium]